MKYITVPESIKFHLNGKPTADPPMSFADFVVDRLLEDVRFQQSRQTVRFACKLEESVRAVKPGETWVVDEAHLSLLTKAAEEPQISGPHGPASLPGWGMSPRGARQVLPFVDAIANASDERPTKAANED